MSITLSDLIGISVSLMALTACTTRTIEGVALTEGNSNCRGTTFSEIMERHVSSLGTGRHRHLIEETLSEMAIAAWSKNLSSLGRCEVRYKIGTTPSQPLYDIEFQSVVTFFVEPSRVCLNHYDGYGPDRNGIRVPDADIDHPWRWIDEGPSVAGLPDGFFAKREYVPVCFSSSGEIEGYLNG